MHPYFKLQDSARLVKALPYRSRLLIPALPHRLCVSCCFLIDETFMELLLSSCLKTQNYRGLFEITSSEQKRFEVHSFSVDIQNVNNYI